MINSQFQYFNKSFNNTFSNEIEYDFPNKSSLTKCSQVTVQHYNKISHDNL